VKLSKHLLRKIIKQINIQKGDCLTDELLIQFANGNVSQEQYQKIVDHLEFCSKCVELWKSYNSFNTQKIYKVPIKVKEKVFREIHMTKLSLILNSFKSQYFALVASILLIISVSILFYMYYLNEESEKILLQQKQRIEELKKNQKEAIAQIASLKSILKDKEKDILRKQTPIIDVPIYDLFPEGFNQRSAAERNLVSIENKNNKPLNIILNLPKKLEGKCNIQIIDSKKKVMWKGETFCANKDAITILIPSDNLAPEKYKIEILDAASLKVLVSYQFILRSN